MYLFIVLNIQGEELDQQIDEGFEDVDDREELDYIRPEDHQAAASLVESDSEEEVYKNVK